jgi:PelA/Pel-15E family pectate lyase
MRFAGIGRPRPRVHLNRDGVGGYWYSHFVVVLTNSRRALGGWAFGIVLIVITTVPAFVAGSAGAAQVSWPRVLEQPSDWYGSSEARRIADAVLTYQRASGGWPKDIDMTRPATDADAELKLRSTAAERVPDATIDNGATTTQMRFLALVSRASGDSRYRDAVIRALDYLLKAQYPSGGWPQFYPLRADYSRYVTFNDNAMINVMTVLSSVARAGAPFDGIDPDRRARARAAVDKGIDVILKTQIRVAGRLTAWCAQYDDVTFEPRGARTYEHVSLSGQESVGIVRFLMEQERGSGRDAQIRAAVDSAVDWFRAVTIRGQRVERRPNAALPSGYDVVVVADEGAPPLWARFYEIGTNRPIFSGRDGVIRSSLAEIEHERRTGYAWFGTWPQALLEKEHPAWVASRK